MFQFPTPFGQAGGGAIPLEALRVGADTFASDLNPVAVLLNKVVLDYIPKYGKQLIEGVRKYGQWIKNETKKELSTFYPTDPDGAIPIAYLWARTVLSESPDKEDIPVEVPLMRSMWLIRKSNRKWALRWVRDTNGQVQTERVKLTYVDGKELIVRRPLLEIFRPKRDSEVELGTIARGSATCPVTGYTTSVARVRAQLGSRNGGVGDARLICVVTSHPKASGRIYRLPTELDLQGSKKATDELKKRMQMHSEELSLVPDEPIPTTSGGFIGPPAYGHNTWGSLFSPRQALTLSTFALKTKALVKELPNDKEFIIAIQTCIALVVDRCVDKCASLVVWDSTRDMPTHVFGRQALGMVWDFAEANPFCDATGSWNNALTWVLKVCEKCKNANYLPAMVERVSAINHPLSDDSSNAFITDPPYYNAVPYADISDFFYVWLNRMIGKNYPNLFQDILSPKDDECCEMSSWDSTRYPHKDNKWFEKQMTIAMAEGRRILAPDGIGVVVFAHKSTGGWEALLQAMIDAGWIVTASWPLDTEMANRLRAQNSAALGSSIHLICRPRENPDGSIRTDFIGSWRDILDELPKRIHGWMPRLAEEDIVGADAIFACLGPALEIYSQYSSVEKANGEKVTLKEYLEEVWAAVSREALNMIFKGADASGFEEDARLTAMWLWTLQTAVNGDEETNDEDEKTSSLRGYSMEYDAARKIAQGLGAHLENLSHLVEIKGNTATLLTAGARTRYLFGKDAAGAPKGKRKKKTQQMTLDFGEEVKELEDESGNWAGELSGKAGNTVLDQLHQSMILFGAGRSEALKRFLIEEGVGQNPLFWRLAQALSALYLAGTDEKRWVDGVLARKKGFGF